MHRPGSEYYSCSVCTDRCSGLRNGSEDDHRVVEMLIDLPVTAAAAAKSEMIESFMVWECNA